MKKGVPKLNARTTHLTYLPLWLSNRTVHYTKPTSTKTYPCPTLTLRLPYANPTLNRYTQYRTRDTCDIRQSRKASTLKLSRPAVPVPDTVRRTRTHAEPMRENLVAILVVSASHILTPQPARQFHNPQRSRTRRTPRPVRSLQRVATIGADSITQP